MRFKYYLGSVLVCESDSKVHFTAGYPAIVEKEEEVKASKKTKSTVVSTVENEVKEEL